MRAFLVILALVIIAIVTGNYLTGGSDSEAKLFTAPVTRGDITEAVAVTGFAEPVEVRVVQAEVPGVVSEVHVDFNEKVDKGDLLARLSSDMQRVQLKQAEAQFETAQVAIKAAAAAVERARAGVMKAEADLSAARREYETAAKNQEASLIPQSKVDSARDLMRSAEAGVAEAKGLVAQAEAGRLQAQNQAEVAKVAIELANLHLDKSELRSNMAGIVLDRDIRVGETVGRPKVSLTESSPALFKIAAPLDRMRAVVKVSEADYSRVKVKQTAAFTIDAYPDEHFEAEVIQIRSAPNSDRTAVSYATVLEFSNRRDPNSNEWMVKPRSTVSADIEVRKAKDVLLVPNSALLYTPSRFDREIPKVEGNQRLVWTLGADGDPEPIVISTGISDGIMTEVTGGPLEEDVEVITGEPIGKQTSFQLPFSG